MNFQCQHCDRVCEWETREPIEVNDATEWKSIGSRYCHAEECIEAEARAHGLPIERVRAWHHITPGK